MAPELLTASNGGAPAVTGAVNTAAVEHGTESDLEAYLMGEESLAAVDPVEPGVEAEPAAADGEPEGESAGEEEAPAETEPEPDEHHDDKNLPQGVQKRINKLTALRREAEEARDKAAAESTRVEQELAQLRGRLEAATADAGARAGVSRMAAMQSEQALEDHAGKLMQIKGLLMKNADGYESEDGAVSLSAEEVQQKLLEVDRELMVDYPKAVRLMAQRQQANASAAAVYPDLFAKDGAAGATLQSALLSIPGLAAMPNAAFLVGDMLAGERMRAAGLSVDASGNVVRADGKPVGTKAAAAKVAAPVHGAPAPVVKPKAPVVPPPSRGGVAPVATTGGKGASRWDRVAIEGTEEALEDALLNG